MAARTAIDAQIGFAGHELHWLPGSPVTVTAARCHGVSLATESPSAATAATCQVRNPLGSLMATTQHLGSRRRGNHGLLFDVISDRIDGAYSQGQPCGIRRDLNCLI